MASDSASASAGATATSSSTTTTTTTTTTTSTASRRQSCDRCHGQKLRCTRASGSNTGACNRCLRQNAQCVYSFSLPKGRPSMYRLHMANSASSSSSRASSCSNLAATAPTSAAASASASSSSSALNQSSTSPATPEPLLPSNRSDSHEDDAAAAAAKADVASVSVTAAAGSSSDVSGSNSSNNSNKHGSSSPMNMNGGDDNALLAGPMDTDAATENSDMSIWSWLAEPFNWGDMQIDMDDSSRSTSTMDLHQAMMDGIHQLSDTFADAAFPYIAGSGGNSSNWGGAAVETRTASPAHLQMLPEQQLHHHHHHHHQQQQQQQHQQHQNQHQLQHAQQQQHQHIHQHLGPDAGIAQLSQLSMRLYPLHRTCCSLAETVESLIQTRDFSQAHILPSLLVDDATFKLVAQWLVHVSTDASSLFLRTEASQNQNQPPTLGDTLLDAFSASCHLLEIMRCLQADAGFWPNNNSNSNNSAPVPAPLPTPSASLDGNNTGYLDLDQSACNNNNISSSLSSTSTCSTSPPSFSRPPNQYQYSNTVMRHLVIACHTLLLNIFVAVLTALQHDGDLRSTAGGSAAAAAAAAAALSVAPNGNGGVDPDARPDVGLADIRLVMIVQLCSYLTERQCRAVHSYLSPPCSSSSSSSSSSSTQQQQQLFDIPQNQAVGLPASLPTTHTTSAEVIELEMEVRHRITRLRQTLLI